MWKLTKIMKLFAITIALFLLQQNTVHGNNLPVDCGNSTRVVNVSAIGVQSQQESALPQFMNISIAKPGTYFLSEDTFSQATDLWCGVPPTTGNSLKQSLYKVDRWGKTASSVLTGQSIELSSADGTSEIDYKPGVFPDHRLAVLKGNRRVSFKIVQDKLFTGPTSCTNNWFSFLLVINPQDPLIFGLSLNNSWQMYLLNSLVQVIDDSYAAPSHTIPGESEGLRYAYISFQTPFPVCEVTILRADFGTEANFIGHICVGHINDSSAPAGRQAEVTNRRTRPEATSGKSSKQDAIAKEMTAFVYDRDRFFPSADQYKAGYMGCGYPFLPQNSTRLYKLAIRQGQRDPQRSSSLLFARENLSTRVQKVSNMTAAPLSIRVTLRGFKDTNLVAPEESKCAHGVFNWFGMLVAMGNEVPKVAISFNRQHQRRYSLDKVLAAIDSSYKVENSAIPFEQRGFRYAFVSFHTPVPACRISITQQPKKYRPPFYIGHVCVAQTNVNFQPIGRKVDLVLKKAQPEKITNVQRQNTPSTRKEEVDEYVGRPTSMRLPYSQPDNIDITLH